MTYEPVTLTITDPPADRELRTIMICIAALDGLDGYDARERVLNYLCERYPIVVVSSTPSNTQAD